MDLEQLFAEINALDPTVLVVEGDGGQAISGSIQLDDNKMNKLLVKVSMLHIVPCDIFSPPFHGLPFEGQFWYLESIICIACPTS